MNQRDILSRDYPNLISLFDEDLDEIRYFVVVDPNIEEEADEADIIDPTEYNWMVYFPERIREALGDELFLKIYPELEKIEAFEDTFDAEEDLYGILTNLEEEEIAKIAMDILEKLATQLKEKSV